MVCPLGLSHKVLQSLLMATGVLYDRVLNVDTITAKNGTSPVTLTKQSAPKHWVNYDSVNQTTDGSFNQTSLTDVAEQDGTHF